MQGSRSGELVLTPKPAFSPFEYRTVQDPTTFACGDLSMRVMLTSGRVSGQGMGSYWGEKRVALLPVCVAWPTDSAGRERGDCSRWRTDTEVYPTAGSYFISIVRKN
jgi:hypothetical protein